MTPPLTLEAIGRLEDACRELEETVVKFGPGNLPKTRQHAADLRALLAVVGDYCSVGPGLTPSVPSPTVERNCDMKSIQKARSELEFIRGAVGATEQDWDRY